MSAMKKSIVFPPLFVSLRSIRSISFHIILRKWGGVGNERTV